MKNIFLIVMMVLCALTLLVNFAVAWAASPIRTIFAIGSAVVICAGLRWYLRRRWMRGLAPPRQAVSRDHADEDQRDHHAGENEADSIELRRK